MVPEADPDCPKDAPRGCGWIGWSRRKRYLAKRGKDGPPARGMTSKADTTCLTIARSNANDMSMPADGFRRHVRQNWSTDPVHIIWNAQIKEEGTLRCTGPVTLDSEHTSLPRLEVRDSPGKGRGLYTLDDIPAYTKVLEDPAVISLARGEDLPQLWQKYQLLDQELQQSFAGLGVASHSPTKEADILRKLKQRGYSENEASRMARVNSIFQANAFKTGDTSPTGWSYALFPTVARINHSCTPSCHAHYRPASGAQVVYSLRPIKVGEELSIAYFNPTMSLSDRQTRAKSWGFACTCPACVEDTSVVGSRYETQLHIVRNGLVHTDPCDAGRMTPEPETVLRDRQYAISIAEDVEQYPWLCVALPRLYRAQSRARPPLRPHKMVSMHGSAWSPQTPVIAAEKALEWECKIRGSDSAETLECRKELRRVQRQWEGVLQARRDYVDKD